MTAPVTPTTFALDAVNDRSIPLRFIHTPATGEVAYYDRRFICTPDDPGYHTNNMCEHGQLCGPRLHATDFTATDTTGITGWNDIKDWDVDAATVRMVAHWLDQLAAKGIGA